MAVARSQTAGGFTAIHVWLIAFVALWLASTVFLVIVYLDQDKKDTAVANMRADLEKVVSRSARRLPQFAAAKPGDGNSMADLLESARSRIAELAVGDPDATADVVQESLSEKLQNIRANPRIPDPSVFADASYDEALGHLFDLYRGEAEARDEARETIESLTAELASARETGTKLASDFDADAARLEEQLQELRTDRSRYGSERDAQIDAFEKQLEEIRQQCSDDIQAQRRDNQRLREDYDELLARFSELKAKLGQAQVSPEELATARVGDGIILEVSRDDDVVYIDLGAEHEVTLGLEFAVYDSLTGIPASGEAKARIEVVSVFDQTSQCRIVQRHTLEPVLDGDIIANPIYDRDRPLQFFILGTFDLDGDLKTDPSGDQRIAALIEAWGGVVENRLSGQVDFVVLGGPPKLPRLSPDLDPEDDPQYQAAQRARQAYDRQLDTVQSLALPTLTQSTLLRFLGYRKGVGALAADL